MKELKFSTHVAKSETLRTFKQRLCLLTKTLKKQIEEAKLISLDKKCQDCSESILSANDSNASKAVNFNKRKLIKKKTSLVEPFCQKDNMSSPYLNSKRVYTCLDINSIEKLSNEQISNKNLANIKSFDKQKMIDKLVKLKNEGNLVYS